ncbi:hypothetical protein [Burkholderia phage BCSR5]|nr:hypothetical protein [Burkholderia phage BCSR5]
MATVLHRGVKPSEKKHKVTCDSCNSVIEYQQHEGKVTYDQRDGNFITFKCEVCDSNINKAI